MFKKKWKNAALIEGEKEALLISRMENFPQPDSNFNGYPVDITIEKKVTFFEAIKKAAKLSAAGIYNLFYKED